MNQLISYTLPSYNTHIETLYSLAWEKSMLKSELDPMKQINTIQSHHILWQWVFVIVYVCVSLSPILEPKHWAVWVWALRGRNLGVMVNTILFANSSDYCSSGCQDPNKQIIPKTNASTHSRPSRADYAAPTVCVCLCMCESIQNECMHIYLDYVVQEHSFQLQILAMQYRAIFLLIPLSFFD